MANVDVESDRALRTQILQAVERLAVKGFVTYPELERVMLPTGATQRVIDRQRGIWNPSNLAATLSIKSTPHGPYEDEELDGGLFRYAFEKEGKGSRNGKMRIAYEAGLELILFRQIDKGLYDVTLPVRIAAIDEASRTYLISLEDIPDIDTSSGAERSYRERMVMQRLHQKRFRALVLRAYETRCAVCRLKYGNLLDAAHIVGDREDLGDAITSNGLSLCKIHHAAYDANIMGIDPQGTVHVQQHFLQDTDGPMLLHGIKEMNGRSIERPGRRSDRPDPDRLESRYQRFLSHY